MAGDPFVRLASWPVDTVAAAIITDDGVTTTGDVTGVFHLASLTKPMVAWAILVAFEEGVIDLDAPLAHADAPTGATMRHLLAHAAGFPFEGTPLRPIEQRRTYSNTGFERAAQELEAAAQMPIVEYLTAAVFDPLGMRGAELRGSPAHGVHATVDDVVRFIGELREPRLLAASTATDAVRPQYPSLGGIVPGVGKFDPCPWGLGLEIKGDKSPHWMGAATSASTFGHFGGAGTMMWVDPTIADRGVGVVALTDRPFQEWANEAITSWARWSDAVVESAAPTGPAG